MIPGVALYDSLVHTRTVATSAALTLQNCFNAYPHVAPCLSQCLPQVSEYTLSFAMFFIILSDIQHMDAVLMLCSS